MNKTDLIQKIQSLDALTNDEKAGPPCPPAPEQEIRPGVGRPKTMKVASFFAGCGGLDLGFEQAGFNVVWANELEPHCKATYIRNHPNTEFVLGDICDIEPMSIPDCDGFIGGPPCQSWSVGGKQRGLDDERGMMFLKYIELINTKRPKFFLIENVKGMLDEKFKIVFDDFIMRLECAGYNVKWKLLDAVCYGVPQNRERVFFVGIRNDLNKEFAFPSPTNQDPITLERAIGDIKDAPTTLGDAAAESKFINHEVPAYGFGSFYCRGNRRRGWNQPSFTINATVDFVPLHPSSPKMLYFGHENWRFQNNRMNEYRKLSVRECARIQTFPDNFVFEYDDVKDAYKMIGNAVPPRLGRRLAQSILYTFSDAQIGYKDDANSMSNQSNTCVLVGYYKSNVHLKLILHNKLYYVRSDGRNGSVFRDDCSIMPKYLLLHHKEKAEMYELEVDEPILAESSFLKPMGFKTSGHKYLCFRLKSVNIISTFDFRKTIDGFIYNPKEYAPYFTNIEKIIRPKYEC